MGLVSGPVPLKSPVVAVVPWAVVEEWVAVRFWGWVPWDLLNLVAQELLDHLLFVLSFFWLHRCGHVTILTWTVGRSRRWQRCDTGQSTHGRK